MLNPEDLLPRGFIDVDEDEDGNDGMEFTISLRSNHSAWLIVAYDHIGDDVFAWDVYVSRTPYRTQQAVLLLQHRNPSIEDLERLVACLRNV